MMNLLFDRRALLRAALGPSAALLLALGESVEAAPPEVVKSPAPKKAPDPALVPIKDDPALPRVLLIGDSISMGYTVPVRELLRGKANVHHPPENCAETGHGLKALDKWLGTGKWDVIHFNFGLHDLKYLDAQGKYVTPDKGKQVTLVADYERNLGELIARMKPTGAHLIWTTTTPVPDKSQGRVEGDEIAYNAAAERVVKANPGVTLDDLHAVAAAHIMTYQLPHNVHFTKEGYQALAVSAAASIEKVLKTKAA